MQQDIFVLVILKRKFDTYLISIERFPVVARDYKYV